MHVISTTKNLHEFEVRLASFTSDGSLIGKHYKTLAQIMPFLAHGLVPDAVLDAWGIIGELVVLLWHTKIENLEDYIVSLISDILILASKYLIICRQIFLQPSIVSWTSQLSVHQAS
jgi:hypothetical protein